MLTHNPRRLSVLVALALTGGNAFSQTPTFRSTVQLVHVDASVLDDQRRPVHGLTQADFTVLENGSPRPVRTFVEVSVPDPDDSALAWVREVGRDVQSNLERGRVLVLVLDDARSTAEQRPRAQPPPGSGAVLPLSPDEVKANVKAIANRIVDGMAPDDVAAVVFTADRRGAQDFTSDRQRLRAAIDSFKPKQFEIPYIDWNKFTLGTLNKIAKNMETAPPGRKSLVWISPGVPVRLTKALPGSTLTAGSMSSMAPDPAVALIIARNTLASAQRAGITVYQINPRSYPPDASADEAPILGRAPVSPEPMFTRAVVDETGGIAVNTPRQFTAGIRQILRETGSYYLFGYEPPPDDRSKAFRNIEVRVTRPAVTVHARTGYFAGPPPKSDKPVDPLLSALAGVLPANELALHGTAVRIPIAGRKEAAVLVVFGIQQPAPVSATEDAVRWTVRAFSERGDREPATSGTAHVRFRSVDDPSPEVSYEIRSRLDLKPGLHELRVSASSTELGRTGSLYLHVEVPEFSKVPIAMSSIVLTQSGSKSAASAVADNVIPVDPALTRVFSPADQIGMFVRLMLRRGTLLPIRMHAYVTAADGTTAFAVEEPIDPGRVDAAGHLDWLRELPLGKLSSGSYLLVIEAATTAKDNGARQQLRFVVR